MPLIVKYITIAPKTPIMLIIIKCKSGIINPVVRIDVIIFASCDTGLLPRNRLIVAMKGKQYVIQKYQ